MSSHRHRHRRAIVGLLVSAVFVVAVVSVAAWRLHMFAPVKEAKASAPASSAALVRADGRITTYPNASAVVGTEKGGTLTAFKVGERQTVKRGEVLAELDASEQQAAIAEANARMYEADVSIGFLRTQIAKSKRLEALGAVPRDEVDRLQHQLDGAVAQRGVAAATAKRLQTGEAKSKVRAPFDGTVLERHAEEGETLAPGARLVTIADLSRLRIEAEVDEFDAAHVAVGAVVTITAEGHAGSWTGAVEEVPQAITRRRIKPDDPTRPTDTRVLLVKISFAEPATTLRLGQRVEVAIGR